MVNYIMVFRIIYVRGDIMFWFFFWIFICGILLEMGKDLYRTVKEWILFKLLDRKRKDW